MKFLAYPVAFPCRPMDRLLVHYLSLIGIQADAAELMMYRLWRDYASGNSDRRTLASQGAGGFNFGADPQVLLLEQSSGFTGDPGKLVDCAIKAGFLVLEGEGDGNRYLVCKDFYPINAPSRSRGAYQRALENQAEKAKKDTKQRLALWSKTGVSSELEPEQEKAALYFLQCVCRALHPMKMPADEVLHREGGLLKSAWGLLRAHAEEDVFATQRWLIKHRKEMFTGARLEGVIERWSEFSEAAKRESA